MSELHEMEQTFGFSEGELRDVGFGGEVEDFALHGEGFDEYQRLLGELLEDEDFSKTLLRLEIRKYRLGLEQYKHSYSPQANAWETLRSWPYPLPDGQALQKTLQDRGGGAFHITFFHDETPHFQCVVQLKETETMQPPRREEHRSDFAEIALKGDGVIGKLTDKALNSGDAVIGMLNNNVRDLRDTIERMSKDHRDQLETMRRDHKEEREKLEAKLEAIKSQPPPAKDDDFFKEMFRQKFMSPSPDEGKHPPVDVMNHPYVRGIEMQLADLKTQTNQLQTKLEQEREKRSTAEMKAAMLETRLQFTPATQQTQSIDPLDMLTRSFGIVEKVRNMAGIQEPAASAPSEAAAPANPLLEMGKEALGGFLQSDAGKEVMGEVFRGLAGGVMGGGGGTPSATGFRPARTQPRRDPAPQLQPTPQPQPRPAPQPQPQPRPAPQPQPQTSTPKRPPSRPAAPPAPPTPPPSPPKPAPRPVPQTIRLRLVENEATSPTVAPSEAPQTPSAPLDEAVPASISTTPTAPFAEDKLAWLGILEEAVESDTHPLVLREMVDAETLDNLRAFPPDMFWMVLKSNLPEDSPLLTEKGEAWVRKAFEVL